MSNLDNRAKLRLAAEWIAEADAIFIGAGAGMGVDSGLPDFRGDEGFWNAYPPYRKLGYSFSQMADPMWFSRDPAIAWGFYGHRLDLYLKTVPHDGFNTLLEWGKQKQNQYFVFTSNVDGQFHKAGYNEKQIYEVHGSIHHLQCTRPCNHDIWSAQGAHIEVDMDTMKALEPFPTCPRCGSLARPNILMFGDGSWLSHRSDIQSNRMQDWLANAMASNMVVIEMGAGAALPTVRWACENVTAQYDARFIRINPRDYNVPEHGNHQIGIALGTLEALAEIKHLMESMRY